MNACQSCGAAMRWVKTEAGKNMPLDPEPIRGGNVEMRNGVAHVVQPDDETRRYVSHFSTCPNANGHRTKPRRVVARAKP